MEKESLIPLKLENVLFCCEIEITSGPKGLLLLFCHLNLSALTALSVNKLFIISMYCTIPFIIVFLSETFFSSSFEIDNDNLKVMVIT